MTKVGKALTIKVTENQDGTYSFNNMSKRFMPHLQRIIKEGAWKEYEAVTFITLKANKK